VAADNVMHVLYAGQEATVKAYRPYGTLVPFDRITSIRIRYFTLRLAKSDVFTPRFWEHQYVVDQYMNFLKEEDEIYRAQTGSNNLSQLEKKYNGNKEADWDSGFSDG